MGKIIQYKQLGNRTSYKGTKDFKMCRKLVTDIRSKSSQLIDMPERAQEVLDYFKINERNGEVPIVEIWIQNISK